VTLTPDFVVTEMGSAEKAVIVDKRMTLEIVLKFIGNLLFLCMS
jgi:hypothetical protein